MKIEGTLWTIAPTWETEVSHMSVPVTFSGARGLAVFCDLRLPFSETSNLLPPGMSLETIKSTSPSLRTFSLFMNHLV